MVCLSGTAFSQIQIDSIGNVGVGTVSPSAKIDVQGNARIQSLNGSGIRPVFADSTGKLIAQAEASQSNAPFLAIPDNSCTGVTDTITLSGLPASVSSANICVTLNITHTYLADLRIFLVAPTGHILNLWFSNGGAADNLINTVFCDDGIALTSGSAPFTGTFKPNGSLSVWCGIRGDVSTFSEIGSGGNLNPNGDWILKLMDGAGADLGTLNNWAVTIKIGTGLGENNYHPKWINGSFTSSSSIYDNGNIGIGTTAPTEKLEVNGNVKINSMNGIGKRPVYAESTGKLTATAGYSVGDFAQGGIVFWVDENGQNGLVCAKTDQSSGIQWYNGTNLDCKAMRRGVKGGLSNTERITETQGRGSYAAFICAEYNGGDYGDWYLPAKDELNLMYINKATINSTATANGGVAFANTPYFSSTEYSSNTVWRQDFPNGTQFTTYKNNVFHVRAVRAF